MRTRPLALVSLGALLIVPTALCAQDSEERLPTPERSFSALAGFGGGFGWAGFQGEAYFAKERLSVFGGLGYSPVVGDNKPGPIFAGGLRGYLSRSQHRAFLEASVSRMPEKSELRQSLIGAPPSRQPRAAYGPAILAGYQYTALGGFTLMAAVGAGYSPSTDIEPATLVPRFNVGAGFSW